MKGENFMIINDIYLNFLKNYYPFYEWLRNDKIRFVKKAYVYKVNSNVLCDLKNNKVCLDKKFLKKEPIIFFDEFDLIAILFDDKGISKFKSSLSLNDEEKIFGLTKYLNNEELMYQIISKDEIPKNLRCEENIKNVICKELDNLYKNNDEEKIKFLYYEWFSKEDDSIDNIINTMKNMLNKDITNNEIKIYNLISSNYKVV